MPRYERVRAVQREQLEQREAKKREREDKKRQRDEVRIVHSNGAMIPL